MINPTCSSTGKTPILYPFNGGTRVAYYNVQHTSRKPILYILSYRAHTFPQLSERIKYTYSSCSSISSIEVTCDYKLYSYSCKVQFIHHPI
ncbi:hypothetical protein D9R79_15165 [Bacillus anthracis]|nr:hypothetical protein [Bacillus anthracis]TNO92908.1 hypothetical protein FH038_25085 [Bacillus sp. CD3-1a]MDR4381886.1 hypothetical protein [Bacillus anthracis]MDR4424681.1 hypothetical protein [Bacillus anthracis]MDR4445856.1 hypothetical protein [Bacillus anthracis]